MSRYLFVRFRFSSVELQRLAPPVREPQPIKAKSAFMCREPLPYGAERAASAFLIKMYVVLFPRTNCFLV
jgi:hypothetical protein